MTLRHSFLPTHEGRTAVVTGASRGIGQAVCRQLAERGADVIGIDLLDLAETRQLVESAGGRWLGIEADVSDPESVSAAAETVRQTREDVHVLVNNAGIFPAIAFEDMTFSDWRRILGVNLDSQFLMAQAFTPLMKASGRGRIVNLTSGSVSINLPGYVGYKASKLGSVGLTRALASDVAEYGITVNAVSPALTRTPGTIEEGTVAILDTIAGMQAIKKVAEPDDVVGVILFLSSDDSYFVTGQTIYSDGGFVYP